MSKTEPVSGAAVLFGALLAAASLFFTLFIAGALSDLGGSDAAGNAMAEGFTALAIFLLYVLLTALAFVAAIGGDMPRSGRIAALFFLPATFGAIWAAFSLLTHSHIPPGLWPLAIPALAPPLIVFYCLWALIAPLRAAVPAHVMGILVWGCVGLLCLAIWPLSAIRDGVNQREAARIEDWQKKFDATSADAPLWQWTPFLNSEVYLVSQASRETIRNLPRRQADAETMLDRDEFPLGQLSQFDLDPTPALCEKARASLTRRAATLKPAQGQTLNYSQIANEVGAAHEAMNWLVGFACPCDQEALAWEALARAYGAEDYQIADLAKLRDPKEFGRILYNYPPRFSMLTPKATLHAWLNFAEGPGGIGKAPNAAEALAGARKLDHRTTDAVVWLNDPYAKTDRFLLLHFLPDLDLEPTSALCAAALAAVHEDILQAYRPTVDNPLPYWELLERLGGGQPLNTLQWVAAHGCDADAELAAAESLVRGYGDSADRKAMLESLAALHRKR
jgi:hypothetical protein